MIFVSVSKCIRQTINKRVAFFGKQKFKLNKPNKYRWRGFHRCCFSTFHDRDLILNMKNAFTPLAQHVLGKDFARCLDKISIPKSEKKIFCTTHEKTFSRSYFNCGANRSTIVVVWKFFSLPRHAIMKHKLQCSFQALMITLPSRAFQ